MESFTMCWLVVVYAALAANPIGGLVVAVPFGMFKAHLPAWIVFAMGVPLGYLQVLAVDLGWEALERLPFWRKMIERRRSARLERWMAAGYTGWAAFALAPVIGPWLVMALMRYAHVPHRRVALPLGLAIASVAGVLTAGCALVPAYFMR